MMATNLLGSEWKHQKLIKGNNNVTEEAKTEMYPADCTFEKRCVLEIDHI